MSFTKKAFTLIELITVIVTLSILAAIIIPNVSSFKGEADHKAVLSNERNLQTAVDMFGLKNDGATPTKTPPTIGNPQTIEVYALKPQYLRDVPKVKGVNYWLDDNHTVWASMVDAPVKVSYDGAKLTWDTVDGAKLYKVYQSEEANVTSAVKLSGLKYVQDVTPSTGITQAANLVPLAKGSYFVTALDKFNLESAPIKAGSPYSGYTTPDKDYTFANTGKSDIPSKGETTPEPDPVPVNQKPIAVISMSPESNLDTRTVINWSYNGSSDPDGDSIVDMEWTGKQNSYSTAGEYTVQLRVQDSKGEWSEWVSKTFTVNNVKGLYFNGSTSYVWLGSPQAVKTQEYTLETWFKSAPMSGEQKLYRYRLYGNSITMSDGLIGGFYFDSNATLYSVRSTKRYDDNQWHHVAISFNKSQLKLYVDGILERTLNTTAPIYFGAGGSAIGREGDDGISYYKGYLSDVRIWNTARTQEQIQKNMSINLNGTEAGLVANWKLNETSGTIAADSSTNKLNGTVYNGSW